MRKKCYEGRQRATGTTRNWPASALVPNPLSAIAAYLDGLADEAERRGYVFNRARILGTRMADKIPVTRAQVLFEWAHLKDKLVRRDPLWLEQISAIEMPEAHPLFESVDGAIEPWEKIQ